MLMRPLTLHADEAINGEALVEMHHQDLKDLGITSLGHRLTILKGVYNLKMSQDVVIDSDHYVPLCKHCRHLRIPVVDKASRGRERVRPQRNTGRHNASHRNDQIARSTHCGCRDRNAQSQG